MSRHQLAILLTELKTIRLICKCGGVFEASVQALERKSGHCHCPLCGIDLHPPSVGGGDPLVYLVRALVSVAQARDVTVEFVIPTDQPAAIQA